MFRFTVGRGTEDVAGLLRSEPGGEAIEVLVGDGYQANRSGSREAGWDVRFGGCWAHLLRKFEEALPEAPAAMAFLMKDIGALYDIEARALEEGLSAERRLEMRRRESAPIATGLMRSTSGWRDHYSLGGKVAVAMRYARNQRRALFAFLRNGHVPIDNNACERAIRPVAVGRHNWQFSGSVDGAAAAATIYTIVESAKAAGVDPLAYLETLLTLIGTCPASSIAALTPDALANELPKYRDRDYEQPAIMAP